MKQNKLREEMREPLDMSRRKTILKKSSLALDSSYSYTSNIYIQKEQAKRKSVYVPDYKYKAGSSDELIQGMSNYIKECGICHFGETQPDNWELLSNVMTKDKTYRYKVFWDNINPYI